MTFVRKPQRVVTHWSTADDIRQRNTERSLRNHRMPQERCARWDSNPHDLNHKVSQKTLYHNDLHARLLA